MLTRAERLKRARITVMRGGVVDGSLVNPQISESWGRCLAAGLDPLAPSAPERLDTSQLRALRDRDELVYGFASLEMQNLREQIAGSNFTIAFGNSNGVVLQTVSDGDFALSPAGRGIVAGTIWSEGALGTNALGTCAITAQAIIVHGEEHFFSQHAGVSCFAAPILHSDGRLAGVLDASSSCNVRQIHTLALMRMAATHVENSLFLAQQDQHLVLLFHPRAELLNSVSGGLVSFDQNGRLAAINKKGRQILAGLHARPGAAFETVFESSFSEAIRRLHESEPAQLRDLLGSRYAVHWRNRHRHQAQFGAMSKTRPKAAFGGSASFVASDPFIERELAEAERATAFGVPFLICGESGTGKDLLAQAIHQFSGRQGAFVPVNCAGLGESTTESELFGYVAGAFTGANPKGSEGLASAAHNGTLFLDEIADLPLTGQASLLRFLDTGEVRPVGSSKAHVVNAQVIAATNADLQSAIDEGRFRADLFFRLGVVTLTLPPLRERNDFAALAEALLLSIAPEKVLAVAAVAALKNHTWKGNVRELRARLTQLAIRVRAVRIEAEDVERLLGPATQSGEESLRSRIQSEVRATLIKHNNNISRTARTLGVSRNTVYKVLRASTSMGDDRG